MKVDKKYSQRKAFFAILVGSFKAILANPGSVFFSILFPIVFVMIFGAFGSDRGITFRISASENCDTSNIFYYQLKKIPEVRWMHYEDSTSMKKDLIRGRLTGILHIEKNSDSTGNAIYTISLKSTTASANTVFSFYQILDYLRLKMETQNLLPEQKKFILRDPQIEVVRKYRTIDFILPGQLGFSILFSTLFGIAFTFFNLREQLVLKRFYATPVSRMNILLGIGISRLFFQLLNVIVLVVFGHFILDFTLHHGWITFFEILVMTIVMLFLLLGVGLIFSSIVKSDSAIPLLINLFGFPQMLLSGTFFPIDVFPEWLQKICKILPLTQYNDAIRKISFEGQHLNECAAEFLILGIWITVVYIILSRVLRWE